MTKIVSTISSTPAAALAEAGVGMAGILVCTAVGAPVLALVASAFGAYGAYQLLHNHLVHKA